MWTACCKRAATAGDGWLTYFYRPESFAKSWAKIRGFAKEAGKDPDDAAQRRAAADHGSARRAPRSRATMMDWLGKEWDYASWSDSTKDSAIMGTVDECVAQLQGAPRGRRAEDHLRALQVRDGADRDDRARDHSAAAQGVATTSAAA